MRNHHHSFLGIVLVSILSFFTLVSNGSTSGATIVGGKEAVPYSYPFMVSIQNKDSERHFCGGALISPSTVITAAHCTKYKSARSLQVVVGEHNLSKKTGNEQIRYVDKIIIHDDFSYSTLQNDISILHLSKPIDIGFAAQLITLPHANEKFSGKTKAIGWGTLRFGGSSPDELNEVDVKIVNFEKCKDSYGDELLPGMICAGAPGKDACQGDSGGPLFKNNKLVGLTSFGEGCADPNYPGIYTQVSRYIDFINQNILW